MPGAYFAYSSGCRNRLDDRLREAVILVGAHPVEERRPRGLRLGLVESLEYHRQAKPLAVAQRHLLAPVFVAQAVAVEGEKALDQRPEGAIAGSRDVAEDDPEECRQLVRAQGHARDDAEGTPAATLERPEQIRVGVGVGDADLPIRGNDFRFQQV